MMEGGWDFDDEENDKAPVNWSSGNAFHSLIFALFLYCHQNAISTKHDSVFTIICGICQQHTKKLFIRTTKD